MMLETVRPASTIATANPRCCGLTRPTATTIATPKKTPCATDTPTRAASIEPKPGASAQATCPAVKTSASAVSNVRRGTRAVAIVASGPPMAMPIA